VSAFSPSPVDNSHESVLFLLRVTFSNDAQEGAILPSDNRSEFEFCGWFGFWFSLAKRQTVLEFQGERCSECVANSAPVHRKMQQIISSCILDWQVYRLADNDPFPCRALSLFRLSTLTCLTMSALVLLPPSIITFKSICSCADVTDFRRASGRAGSHDDYQSSLCVP